MVGGGRRDTVAWWGAAREGVGLLLMCRVPGRARPTLLLGVEVEVMEVVAAGPPRCPIMGMAAPLWEEKLV